MPHIPTTIRDPEIESAIAERDEFADIAEWQRSKKGNLWRHFDGMTVTIYHRNDDFFGWCVADEYGTRFSRGGYETEIDAMDALAAELDVGVLI